MNVIKLIAKGMLTLMLLIIVMIVVRSFMDARDDYDVSLEGISVPTYTAMDVPYEQTNDFSTAHPFAASAIIDIDGDGVEEIFLGGGPDQSDALLRFSNNEFVQLNEVAGIEKEDGVASFGATVIDTDKDGNDDLLVARADGVWLHRNVGGSFSSEKLPLPIPEDTTPMSAAVADLNRDGHFDLYVAGYVRLDLVEGQNIFNKEGYGGSSHLFMNNGDNTFSDVTEEAGLTYKHNAFMGIFVDIDQDMDEDLVVAHDTGQVRTWKNIGNGKFVNEPNPNSKDYSYPMGIGVGDYNNDGLIDFAFSNVGSTPPNFMVRGDLTDDQNSNWKWLLFENKGGFKFEDTAEKRKVANYEFSWGMTLEDLNLDGREDLVVSENYIGLPPHKLPFLRLSGRLLLQNNAGEFAPAGKLAGVSNKRYSIAPLTADFNSDGYPDIVHVNIAGKSQAFISNGGDAGYLKVQLPNTVESIAATVRVTLDNGTVLTKPFVSGEGLCSDPSHILTFGLGDASATQVFVQYIDGTTQQRQTNQRNALIRF